MNSVIRWAGSKRKLLPTISSYWDGTAERYLEPFAGSAALFFHLKPKRGVLNDNNIELINAYRTLKSQPNDLYDLLATYSRSSKFYYALRKRQPTELNSLDRAARFFYLNRFCFNGIYRVNLQGDFNVPFSKSGTGGFPTRDIWLDAAKQLRRASLRSTDFEGFLKKNVKKGDFVYLDPPYAVSNRRIFSQYSLDSFGIHDMERLSATLTDIDQRGAKFVVSYAMSPEAKLLSKNWHSRRALTQRNVAGFQKHRRTAMEVLISNFIPNEASNG